MITEQSRILLDDVVVDIHQYPRSAPSEATINRYAEALQAGEEFPPIALQEETNLLLDGMHRWKAHILAEIDYIPAEYHAIPDGMPIKLYAASLSARHGDRITNTDLKQVARETIGQNPHYSQKQISQSLGVRAQTVSRWVSDLTEHHRNIRKIRALILSQLGHTQEQIAEELDSKQQTIGDWLLEMRNGDFSVITEEGLREAISIWPDENGEIAEILEDIREEMIFGSWSDDERGLLDQLRSGQSIVVNMHQASDHTNLVNWLKDTNQLVRVDRATRWGNPFDIPDDGDRETVIRKYVDYYLPHKPMLLDGLGTLRGKALGCWCAPKACHGDELVRVAYGERKLESRG